MMGRKTTLVYIVSASHSGSTALSLLLGTHSLMVNLGEVATTFSRWHDEQHICTCGCRAEECVVWGTEERYGHHDTVLYDKYNLLIDRCRSVYPASPYLVDASKDIEILGSIKERIDADIKVILLIRDPRGYISSIKRKNADKKKGIMARLTLSHSYLLRYWLKINSKFHRYLKEREFPCLKITYEDLCLNSKATLSRVSEFLDLQPPLVHTSLTNSTSHILRGNGMRFQQRLLEGIQYDYRWMNETDHLHYPLLFKLYSKRIKSLVL